MLAEVIKKHHPVEFQTFNLHTGEQVKVTGVSSTQEGMQKWVRCQSMVSGEEGWVPTDHLNVHGSRAECTGDFTSRGLDVNQGDHLVVLETMDGWGWCRNVSTNAEGWVPLKHLYIRTFR